jgi:hypothetical protein
MEEEERFFVGKVSKAQVMTLPLIHEFVSRTLQRMVYGMCLALLWELIYRIGSEG